jgi:uncharacterized protein
MAPIGKKSSWAGGIAAALTALAVLAPNASAWQPQPASYGIGSQANLPVTMSDGTVLRVDVYYPTDPKTGEEATGNFPVILSQTPYGKDDAKQSGSLAELAGYAPYLVQRGYIDVLADVRGTGGSQGEWGLFDPVQGHDGATLVNWASALPHSDGDVGLLGASYLGIDQFATAVDAGPTHVKAMFPIIAGNDLYRDVAFAGGFPDLEFDAAYVGLTVSLNELGPEYEGNSDLSTALVDHTQDIKDFDAALLTNAETGGDTAYDQVYWGARNPVAEIAQLVQDRIPAYLIGGWYDLFQRGEPLNYAGFQNAYDHRPVLAPMTAQQPVTPRYQLLQGPWYHVTAGMGLDYHGLDLNGLELAWFDHWLKGVDTGITDTNTPLHLEDLATGQYEEASRYPIDHAVPTAYYLGKNGALSPRKPAGSSPPDELAFTGTEVPCTRSTEQWAAGLSALALSYFGMSDNPCAQDATLSQQGPGTQNYTTAPFSQPATLAGPIGATLYATASTKDTEWVVQVSDIAPDGAADSLTSGLLEGNQRALVPSLSWYAPDGNPLLPYHPYTKVTQTPVIPGKVTKYDVEVFPTFDTIRTSHRLRVTIATSDFPHAFPDTAQGTGLAGGTYELEHSASYPSSVELPLIPAGSALPVVPHTPLGCPPDSGRLSGRRLGPIRLGMTRAGAHRVLIYSSTRGKRYMDFFCLAHGGIRVGYASPKLLRWLSPAQRRAVRGRVVMALTASRHYSLDGVRPGTRLAAVAKRLKLGKGLHVGLNWWYFAPGSASHGLLKVRHGRIEEIGIANAQLTQTRRTQWRFMTSFS